MKEASELQERIESTVVRTTFNVSGMPERWKKELDAYCKENYGDSRWVMLVDFYNKVKEYDKMEFLFEQIAKLEKRIDALEAKPCKGKGNFKTFG